MDHIAKITAQLPEHGLDAMLVTSARRALRCGL